MDAALRYSDPVQIAECLAAVTRDFRSALQDGVKQRATVPFNRKTDGGAAGRIKSDAPAFSPFIRHQKSIDLT